MSKAVFIGGSGGTDGTYSNDVWVTEDNITFTQMADFPSTTNGVTTVFFKDAWYALGGMTYNGTGIKQTTVYKSTDLTTWELVTNSPGWSDRYNIPACIYQNKLWVIGGNTATSGYGEVWNSIDGITWVKVGDIDTTNIGLGYLEAPIFASESMGIFIFGGRQGSSTSSYSNIIYHSTDGITWTKNTANWAARKNHSVVFFNNKFFLIGGAASVGTITSSTFMYTSTDGLNWNAKTDSNLWNLVGSGSGSSSYFSGGNLFGVLDNKMILFGSSYSSAPTATFSTTDGTTWVKDNAAVSTEISKRFATNLGIQNVAPAPTIQGNANSTSAVNMTIDLADLLIIRSNATTISNMSFSLEIGEIKWINSMSANSTSDFNITGLYVGSAAYIDSLIASSVSNVNMLIGFGDVSTHILKGTVTVNGNPIVDVIVKAINKNYNQYVYTTTTDINGQYNLTCNIPGKYILVCYHDGNKLTAKARAFIQVGG